MKRPPVAWMFVLLALASAVPGALAGPVVTRRARPPRSLTPRGRLA